MLELVINCPVSECCATGPITEGAYDDNTFSDIQYVELNQDSSASLPTRFVLPLAPSYDCAIQVFALSS